MGYFEDNVEEQARQAYRNERLAVVLSALVFILHFLEVKIEKVSVGGVELVIKDAFVVKGSLGIVLVYLLLGSMRGAMGKMWLTSVSDPDFSKTLREKKNGYYYVYYFTNAMVGLFEVSILACAIYVSWGDMKKLIGLGWNAFWG